MRYSHLLCLLFVTLSIMACDHDDYYSYDETATVVNKDSLYKAYKVSLMGNSRCTFRGYIPSVNRTFYPRYDVDDVRLTWWWKVIEIMDAKLEINESFSAGRISNRHPSYPSYIDRVGNLGDPNIIFFWGGINDQRNNTPLGTLDFTKPIEELDEGFFATALDKLIRLMILHYPQAEIILFIEDDISDDGYIEVLREVANHYNIRIVDLSGIKTTKCDELHYDARGMQQIADETVRQLGL